LVSPFPGQDNQVHYAGCSVAAVRFCRTTRIEPGLVRFGSLAETIDLLRATRWPGTSPVFDRQTRRPRSHYFAPESGRSCGANEMLRVRRPRQRLRSGSSPWFWRKPVSIVARSKHRSKPGLDAVWLAVVPPGVACLYSDEPPSLAGTLIGYLSPLSFAQMRNARALCLKLFVQESFLARSFALANAGIGDAIAVFHGSRLIRIS
jgi:hypothetical protein